MINRMPASMEIHARIQAPLVLMGGINGEREGRG